MRTDTLATLGLAILSLSGGLGCGATEHAERHEPDIVEGVAVPRLERTLTLVVIDDSNTPASEELREQFAHELAGDVAEPQDDCYLADPAAWEPADRVAIVAYPSLPTSSWLTPSIVSDLALRTQRKTPDNLQKWGDALAKAITTAPDEPRAGFEPLARLTETLTLLGGLRTPADLAEQELLAAVTGVTQVEISFVTAREDASPGAAGAYALPTELGSLESVVLVDAILPSTSGGDCGAVRRYSERFGAWLANLPGTSTHPWAPGDTCRLRSHFDLSCETRCFSEPPAIDDAGRAACQIYAETTADPCPEDLGWVEASQAALASAELDSAHYCEVRQLDGPDLEHCRNDLECEGCQPGFCITVVPELSHSCSVAGAITLPRFIGGAASGPATRLKIICDGASVSR